MIQDIHPHSMCMTYEKKVPGEGDFLAVPSGTKVLLTEEGYLPEYSRLRGSLPADTRCVYLFSLDGRGYFYCEAKPEEGNGLEYKNTMTLRNFEPVFMAFAGITACHLALWYAGNTYCGGCGAVTVCKEDERAVQCPGCGAIVYPRISPAVIVGVTDGDRILVTSYLHRPSSRSSLIAGFMEIGETFEDTVRREVMEESGLRVKNIRYYKSQPWAFSGSVLVGFYADLDGSPDITLDTNELQEALWMDRADMAQIDTSISLTSEMMDVFRRNEHPR